LEICLREILICRLEYAIIHKVENGYFDIERVAQYAQNNRERLQRKIYGILPHHAHLRPGKSP
ncbi:MAG: hypothetical protein J7M40_00345, partial [Planctomycetes bacterium]|nr:hypothetical protein [Planctomycetota bacterium]